MKKNFKLLIATLLVSVAMFGIVNFAVAADVEKIAVVDVQKVVNESKQVKALRAEQQKKAKEIVAWIKTAREDVQKQSTDENKEKLAKKYDELFLKKQEVLKSEYTKKLAEIDKSISGTIEQYAKSKGYTIVVSKSIVLYGGDDITAEISKIVK